MDNSPFVPHVGSKVYFGRTHGEKTLGEVVRVNRSRAKVKQLESRGTYKSFAVGTVWTVPFTLLAPVAEGLVETPEQEIIRLRAENARLRGNRDAQDRTYEKNSRVPAPSKRPESEVLRDIENVYSQLSPENLTCDGELPRGQVLRRGRQLKLRLRGLFTELGREVPESEAYEALRPH